MPIDPLGPSQGALGALQEATLSRASSFRRLATGKRVNAAADDAAALAAAQAFEVQVRGLQKAIDGAQQGISLAQTGEGALSQTQDLLQRGRELAVQAANDALSPQDRAAVQAEYNQIVTAIDKIGNTAQFNGIPLLNGSQATTGLTIQTGAGAGESQTIQIADARAAALGVDTANLTTQAGANAALTALDAALAQVSSQRADLGARTNGLQATAANLATASLNQTAARSQLIDADVAAESARNAGLAIRQNAATFVLAQGRLNAGLVNRLLNG